MGLPWGCNRDKKGNVIGQQQGYNKETQGDTTGMRGGYNRDVKGIRYNCHRTTKGSAVLHPTEKPHSPLA